MEDFNEGMDSKLAAKMRKSNPEQFYTLVKMHLSFELDLNTEDSDCLMEKAKLKKWSLPSFSKKPKSMMNLSKGTEGATLTLDGINRVKQLIEYLSKEQNIVQEGIFRRTGKLTRQQDLKAVLYQGLPLNLDDGKFNVHDCASVLKSFLAELPEPLLTELHYPVHCQIAELCSSDANGTDSRLLRSLQLLLLLLPPVNRILLKHVLNLLNKTASFEHSNKMNCDTLATLFTPHLMCPRKLTPEALHINSQILSGLVAFMIKKGASLFEIPPMLSTDIKAYWLEQERKLLSPKESNLNESISDATGTAHTVFSFIDHKLTAKANSTEDTQAALAQLYAHIQAMPESTKKRRLVKQFNKENGQGTPRQVKQYKAKSLGDSIKKHIFQKKLLGHRKLLDINIGCNISRSSSEENMLSMNLEKSLGPSKTLFSKSDDELSADSCDLLGSENLLQVKHISNSTGSINTPTMTTYKSKQKVMLMSFVNINEEDNQSFDSGGEKSSSRKIEDESMRSSPLRRWMGKSKVSLKSDDGLSSKTRSLQDISTHCDVRISRQLSEPPNMYSSEYYLNLGSELVRQSSNPVFPVSRTSNNEVIFTPVASMPELKSVRSQSKIEPVISKTPIKSATVTSKSRFRTAFSAHTSTPSNLLRQSLASSDCLLTPITGDDKSMSPITQSATKMSKAMQESIMTPRSRKPVMMVSGSNLCNLASIKNDWTEFSSSNDIRGSNFELKRQGCASILEESQKLDSIGEMGLPGNQDENKENLEEAENKENLHGRVYRERNYVTSIEDDCGTTIQKSSVSITSTFREYLLSRSVLTASPVDLSFSSRTGDFEPSESDLNMLNDDRLSDSLLHCLDGNNPESDTSGIGSGSTNSANNSAEKVDSTMSSPRKRSTSLQRNDSKKSVKDEAVWVKPKKQTLKNKQLSESTLNPVKMKDTVQETSF
ncbi:uncharacterized protein LOC105703758 [Orussus abietinus]|uniref:uncharacterized protein LOC105703758 n=1 Tax=Orussus abietinus TaxID=222816 RepID=UPI0006262154|nr:uncharacterized protein LOC105703758 [Orussus abietinus]